MGKVGKFRQATRAVHIEITSFLTTIFLTLLKRIQYFRNIAGWNFKLVFGVKAQC